MSNNEFLQLLGIKKNGINEDINSNDNKYENNNNDNEIIIISSFEEFKQSLEDIIPFEFNKNIK